MNKYMNFFWMNCGQTAESSRGLNRSTFIHSLKPHLSIALSIRQVTALK